MISIAAEPLVYRWAGFSPALSLLMPTFAFLTAPPLGYPLGFSAVRMLPYHSSITTKILSFGTILDARLLSMLCRSTSELLRTL